MILVSFSRGFPVVFPGTSEWCTHLFFHYSGLRVDERGDFGIRTARPARTKWQGDWSQRNGTVFSSRIRRSDSRTRLRRSASPAAMCWHVSQFPTQSIRYVSTMLGVGDVSMLNRFVAMQQFCSWQNLKKKKTPTVREVASDSRHPRPCLQD